LSLSRPIKGRLAIVTDAGRDAVDAAASGVQRDCRASFGLRAVTGTQTNGADADGEVVWSWRSDAGAK
jgi:hypothetical protein